VVNTKPDDRSDPDAVLERELGRLKAEYEKLREEKVRAEQTLTHLESELEALADQALRDYGTADPEELGAKLAAMREENDRLVGDYREHVAKVREGLAELERGVENHDR
jgi:phage shock protein A